MTIAQAFNEIAVAQGGTPSTSGTIAGAIDALNDALAGSDQQAAQTIEDAVRLLGQNIGGGGEGGGGGGDATEYDIKCYLSTDNGATYTETESIIYEAEWSTEEYTWVKKEGTQPLTKSAPGASLAIDAQEGYTYDVSYGLGVEYPYPSIPISMSGSFVMPAHSIAVARIFIE